MLAIRSPANPPPPALTRGRRLFQVNLSREVTRFFSIEHGLEAEMLRMAARARASCRTDGPIDMKAPFEPARQGLAVGR